MFSKRAWDRGRRLKAIAILGGICVKCGFTDWKALQIDHIYGGGTYEGTHVALEEVLRRRNLEKYQLLCANCNAIKKIDNEEHRWNYTLGHVPKSDSITAQKANI